MFKQGIFGLQNRDYLLNKKKWSLKLLAESLLPSVGMLAQVNLAFPIKKAVTMTSLTAGFLSFIYVFFYPLCPDSLCRGQASKYL